MKLIARFHPQAWVNDYAVDVDPEGAIEWDVTEHLLSMPEHERERCMAPDNYDSDTLKDVSNAPRWVQDWGGPFYVSVEEREQWTAPPLDARRLSDSALLDWLEDNYFASESDMPLSSAWVFYTPKGMQWEPLRDRLRAAMKRHEEY